MTDHIPRFYAPGGQKILIERATPADAVPVLEFCAEVYEEWYNGVMGVDMDVPRVADSSDPNQVSWQATRLADPNKIHVVARDTERGNRIVGLAYVIVGDTVLLEEWDTLKTAERDYRGSGVGAAVLDVAYQLVPERRRQPNTPFKLEVLTGSPTISLYEAMGLKKVDQTSYPTIIRDGTTHDIMLGTMGQLDTWLNRRRPRVFGT